MAYLEAWSEALIFLFRELHVRVKEMHRKSSWLEEEEEKCTTSELLNTELKVLAHPAVYNFILVIPKNNY